MFQLPCKYADFMLIAFYFIRWFALKASLFKSSLPKSFLIKNLKKIAIMFPKLDYLIVFFVYTLDRKLLEKTMCIKRILMHFDLMVDFLKVQGNYNKSFKTQKKKNH